MKKDTLFLIIAALTLFVAWRTYRLHKNNGGKTEPDTEPDNGGGNGGNGGNGGGNPNPNPHIEPNIDPLDPDNPSDPSDPNPGTGDELISLTTIEKCPYCGTPGAEVTRIGHSLTSKMFIKTVVCPNKSCPGAVEAKTVFKSKKFETEK